MAFVCVSLLVFTSFLIFPSTAHMTLPTHYSINPKSATTVSPEATTPFASVKLVAPSTASKPGSNPFASVKLQAPKTAPSKPSLSLGSGTTSSSSTSSSLSFGTAQTKAPAPSVTSIDKTNGSVETKSERIDELCKSRNEAIVQMVKENPSVDLSSVLQQYCIKLDRIRSEEAEKNKKRKTNVGSPKPAQSPATAPVDNTAAPVSCSAMSKPLFGFGAASPSTSSPASTAPKSGFLFGGAPPAPAPPAASAPKANIFGNFASVSTTSNTAKATTFSFGAAPSSSAPPAGTTAALSGSIGATNNDDAMPKMAAEKAVKNAANDEWTEKHKVYAQYYRMDKKEWKAGATGDILLEQNKKDPSVCRVIMRDKVGKVLLNLGISKGMDVQRNDQKSSTGEPRTIVQFVSVKDATIGPQLFSIRTKPEAIEGLENALKEMTK